MPWASAKGDREFKMLSIRTRPAPSLNTFIPTGEFPIPGSNGSPRETTAGKSCAEQEESWARISTLDAAPGMASSL